MASLPVVAQAFVSLAGFVLGQPTSLPPAAAFPDQREVVPSAEPGDAQTESGLVDPVGVVASANEPTSEALEPRESGELDCARVESWYERYTCARQQLTAGDFAEAAQKLRRLADSAATSAEQERALELAEVAEGLKQWNLRSRAPNLERARVSPRLDERSMDELVSLYVSAVAYGIGTGGFIAVHAEPESAAGGILPALVLSGLGGAAVAFADSQGAFRYGVPQAITTGMYFGLEQGIAWTIWNQARASWLDQWSDETVATLIWGATSAGAVAGGVIGANTRTTPGQASYVGSAGLWGGVLGGLLSAAFTGDEERQDDAGMLGGALGLNAGAALGLATVGSVSPSIARVRLLDLGGIAGGILAGGLYLSAADERADIQPAFGLTALGIAGGLGAAWMLTRGMAQDLPVGGSGNAALVERTRAALIPLDRGAMFGLSGTL